MKYYKKLYIQETKTNVEPVFTIHHINGNHWDNSIINLVALPEKLHTDYHKVEKYLEVAVKYYQDLINKYDAEIQKYVTERDNPLRNNFFENLLRGYRL